jgi:hypothetical protein
VEVAFAVRRLDCPVEQGNQVVQRQVGTNGLANIHP